MERPYLTTVAHYPNRQCRVKSGRLSEVVMVKAGTKAEDAH